MNNRRIIGLLTLTTILLLWVSPSFAQEKDIFSILHLPKEISGYANDFANILTEEQEKKLNDTLAAYEKKTTHQIVILIADSLYGENIDEVCPEIAQTWGIGQKGQDNGVLISLFIKDRKLRIDVGYGLEAYLTDVSTDRIRELYMQPRFRNGDFFGGLNYGILYI